MVKSMTAAISGLQTHQSKMDVISHNIANVNTWGFKARTANFQDAMYQNVTVGSGGADVDGGIGGVNSSQLGFGVNLGSISTNHGVGSWGYTGQGLNCMIDGTGFFIVGPAVAGDDVPVDELAENGMSLTRVGIFTIDDNGYLVDAQGNYVYGFSVDDPLSTDFEDTYDEMGRIVIPEDPDNAGEQFEIQSVTIGTDGVVTGIAMDNSKITIGKLALASVENVNGLNQTAGYLYNIGANAGDVTAVQSTGSMGKVLSNYLEMANVDLSTEIAGMITTQRGYQANTKIITVTDEMLEELVNMKR